MIDEQLAKELGGRLMCPPEGGSYLEVNGVQVSPIFRELDDMIGWMLAEKEKPQYIKKENLMKWGEYICTGERCPRVCMWDGKVFHGLRVKFGKVVQDTFKHWDDDPKYGLVKPLIWIGPVTMPEIRRLYENKK
jgi:hypothetical protein